MSMNQIVVQGVVESDGTLKLDQPVALPPGAVEVTIEPLSKTPMSLDSRAESLPIEAREPTIGMREEEWPATAEGIAALLARMDALEPGWLSPEDDAAWRSALRTQRNIEKVRFSEDADKLRRMWE
jgi:hypothetical protein